MPEIILEFVAATIATICLAQLITLLVKLKPTIIGAVACAVFSAGQLVKWSASWWSIGLIGVGIGIMGHAVFNLLCLVVLTWAKSRRGYW